ncbi:MAG: protein kinase [Candidatus Hydrogenedentes bacterium]|nr:protein kinase [Candidatus Hydrogenedentota bacterium]
MSNTTKDLLFGVIATRLNCVTSAELAHAAESWIRDPATPLPQHLIATKAMSPDDSFFLKQLVDAAVESSGGDSGCALERLGGSTQVEEAFAKTIIVEDGDDGLTVRLAEHAAFAADEGGHAAISASKEELGRYRLVKEHARGGMGRILLVHDEFVGRDVALKELLPDLAYVDGGKREWKRSPYLTRFLQEARITGQLEHPSIVPVHEIGFRNDGTLYYTMKLVRGRTLREAISSSAALVDRLKFLPHYVGLCNALAYAHSRGVIHRDIKPSNVMVGEFGETVVLDWGLAKVRDTKDIHCEGVRETIEALRDAGPEAAAKTRYGTALGTPAYMPPEQAEGRIDEIDERSDVYSLGAVLYELLTGHAPYGGTAMRNILQCVITEEPTPILSLEPDAPRELVAICRRAMRKDASGRYPSAKALAEEIGRFQAGALVQAYEYRFGEHLKRFLRKHRSLVVTSAAAALVLLVVGVYSYLSIVSKNVELTETANQRDAQAKAAEQARNQAEGAAEKALASEQVALAEKARADKELYFTSIRLAQSQIDQRNFDAARRTLADSPVEHRNWEWGRLMERCNEDSATYKRPHFAANGQSKYLPVVVDIDGDRLAMVTVDGSVDWYDLRSHDLRHRITPEKEGRQVQIAISPDGRYFACLDNTKGTVLSISDFQPVVTFDGIENWQWTMEFSANGTHFAYRDPLTMITKVQDLDHTDAQPVVLDVIANARVRVSPDGGRLLTVEDGQTGNAASSVWRLHDTGTGAVVQEATTEPIELFGFVGRGDRLFVAYDTRIDVIDVTDGRSVAVFAIETGKITGVFGGIVENTIAFGDTSGTVRVADLASRRIRSEFKAHNGAIRSIAATPDGRLIVSGGDDRRIHVLDSETASVVRVFEGHSSPVTELYVDGSGTRIASVAGSEVKLWDVKAPPSTMHWQGGPIMASAVSTDGLQIYACDGDGVVTCRNLLTGAVEWTHRFGTSRDVNPVFRDDAAYVAVRSAQGLTIWNTGLREPVFEIGGANYSFAHAAFSPTDDVAAIVDLTPATREVLLRIVDLPASAQTGAVVLNFAAEEASYERGGIAFMPDGKRIGVLAESILAFYDIESGQIAEPLALDLPERDVSLRAIDQSGDHALLYGATGQVYVADLSTRSANLTLPPAGAAWQSLRFSADGSRIIAGDISGALRIFDSRTGREIYAAPQLNGAIEFALVHPITQTLVAATQIGTVLAERAMPWELGDYPGGDRAQLDYRIETLKRHVRAARTDWGICQKHLASGLDDKIAWALSNGYLKADDPLPDSVRFAIAQSCPAGGAYTAGDWDAVPSCSIHGALGGEYNLLRLVCRLDVAPEAEGALVARAIAAVLPGIRSILEERMEQWTRVEGHYRAALAAGEKRLAVRGNRKLAYTYMGEANLALGRHEQAAHDLSAAIEAGNARARLSLAWALARHGTEESTRSAYDHLEEYLETFLVSTSALELWTELRALPQAVEPALIDRITRLTSYTGEEWRALPWCDSIDEAVAAAQAKNKLVLLSLTTPASLLTDELRRHVLSHPDMLDAVQTYYVPCAIDASRDAEVPKRYGIETLPSLLVLNERGEPISSPERDVSLESFRKDYVRPLQADGYLHHWLIVGPFDFANGAGFDRAYPPETGIDTTAEYDGTNGKARWLACRASEVTHEVRLTSLFGPLPNSVVYAYSEFEVDTDVNAWVKVGSDDGCKLWVNGVWVNENLASLMLNPRAFKRDGDVHGVTLKRGRNTVLLKTVNHTGAFSFSVRVQDGDDPIPSLRPVTLPACPEIRVRDDYYALAVGDMRTHIASSNSAGELHFALAWDEIRPLWREHGHSILGEVNPRQHTDEQGRVGVAGNNLGKHPLLRKLGFQDGDVILSVNDMHLQEVLAVGMDKVTETLSKEKQWRVEILRDGHVLTHIYEKQ